MKKLHSIVVILALVAVVGHGDLLAQMMGQGMTQSSMPQQQTKTQVADTSLAGMMQRSSQMSSMMMQNVSKMETDLTEALHSTEGAQQQAQLEDLQALMTKLRQEMTAQMGLQQQMSEMMQKGGMQSGMMGQGGMMQKSGMMTMGSDAGTTPTKKDHN